MIRGLEKALALVGERNELADALLRVAHERFGGDHGFFLELEETTGSLRELASFGVVEEMLNQDMRIFAQYAVDHSDDTDSVIIAKEAKEIKKLAARKSVRRDMTTGVMLFPLSAGSQSTGVIYLGEKTPGSLHFNGIDNEGLLEVGRSFGRIMSIDRTLNRVQQQNVALEREVSQVVTMDGLVGRSFAIERVRNAIELVSETDVPVTLIGEPGTGKRTAAEVIHKQSSRAKRPFIYLSLEDLPMNMLGGFIFGQAPGSEFAPARGRRGALRDVKGGTLVLDGIEQLNHDLQKKLIRATELGATKPEGGDAEYPVDVRLVLCTTENPKRLFEKEIFSQEFYLKLSVFPVILPPLRDRVEDLPQLVKFYMDQSMSAFGKTISGVSTEVYDFLGTWQWEHNLTELEREIRQAVLRTPDQGMLTPAMLSTHIISQQQPSMIDSGEGTLKQRVARIEKRMIMDCLERNNHNQSLTADQLGLSRQALINKLHRYGIETGRDYKRKMREIAEKAEIEE